MWYIVRLFCCQIIMESQKAATKWPCFHAAHQSVSYVFCNSNYLSTYHLFLITLLSDAVYWSHYHLKCHYNIRKIFSFSSNRWFSVFEWLTSAHLNGRRVNRVLCYCDGENVKINERIELLESIFVYTGNAWILPYLHMRTASHYLFPLTFLLATSTRAPISMCVNVYYIFTCILNQTISLLTLTTKLVLICLIFSKFLNKNVVGRPLCFQLQH